MTIEQQDKPVTNKRARELVDTSPPHGLSSPGPADQLSSTRAARAPAIIVSVVVLAIVGLSLWYLVQPQHIIVQGEAVATRIDIAARVDGRVGSRPVSRGENVAPSQLLFAIANPELEAKLREAEASLTVAKANFAHIEAGTRAEEVAQRKAAMDSAAADLDLSQLTYDRIKQLADEGHAAIQRLDEVTNSLHVSQRAHEQASFAYQEAVAGYTKEERDISIANVAKAQASIDTIQAQVNELTVNAPLSAQVYQIGSEVGEYVSPGVPLLSLVDLSDVWLQFDLREDFVKGLKVGDKFQAHIPALGGRLITIEVRFIAPKGEYSGWRATRATGDFDLRTFEVRAYPVPPVPELRPGMSAYAESPGAER